MLRKFLFATVCVAGLSAVGSFTAAYAADTTTTTTDAQQAALDAQTAAVEALILQYQNDPDGLQVAIQALVEGSDDPSLAAAAVVAAFNNSTNPAVQTALASNAGLQDAGGKGLGAAIATIGVTNPTLATQMTAYVQSNGGTTFASSVQSGRDTQTASIQQGNSNNNGGTSQQDSSTPETPASAT